MEVTRRFEDEVSVGLIEEARTGSASGPWTGPRTIGDLLDWVANQVPGHEALVSYPERRRYTYRELQREVDRCARGLLACGGRQLDRVGICSPHNAEWVITQLALAKIGAVLVCLDPAWDGVRVATVLRQSHASLLIIAPSQRRADDFALLAAICPEARTSPRGQIRSSHLPALHTVVALGTRRPSGAYHWRDLLALADAVRAETLRARQAEGQRDDPVTLHYAWTVAGVSRGVAGSHDSLLAAAACLAERFALTREDRLCIAMPCSQRGGLGIASLACLSHGATMVLPAAALDPPSLLEAVQEEKCTAVHTAPTLLKAMLAHSAVACYDLSSLRTVGGTVHSLTIPSE